MKCEKKEIKSFTKIGQLKIGDRSIIGKENKLIYCPIFFEKIKLQLAVLNVIRNHL